MGGRGGGVKVLAHGVFRGGQVVLVDVVLALHQSHSGRKQVQAQVFAHIKRLFGRYQERIGAIEAADFHHTFEAAESAVPSLAPPRIIRRDSSGCGGLRRAQAGIGQERQCAYGGFQAAQAQRGIGGIGEGALAQFGQVGTNGLFQRQQQRLLETRQTGIQPFEHGYGGGHVVGNHQLLAGQIESGFSFVHHPVATGFQQLLQGAVVGGGFSLLGLHIALQLLDYSFVVLQLAAGIGQEGGILRFAQGSLIDFLVELDFLVLEQVLPLHKQKAAGAEAEHGQHEGKRAQTFAAGFNNHRRDRAGRGGRGRLYGGNGFVFRLAHAIPFIVFNRL